MIKLEKEKNKIRERLLISKMIEWEKFITTVYTNILTQLVTNFNNLQLVWINNLIKRLFIHYLYNKG